MDRIFSDSQGGCIILEDLLNEDPIIALKRKGLEDRISQLSTIKAKLDQFWEGNVPDNLSVADSSPSVSDIPLSVPLSVPVSMDWPERSRVSSLRSFSEYITSAPYDKGAEVMYKDLQKVL